MRQDYEEVILFNILFEPHCGIAILDNVLVIELLGGELTIALSGICNETWFWSFEEVRPS
jgi:hypothetical protein